MSADNRICYMEDLQGRWVVWEGSMSCEYYEPPSDAVWFNTEQEALEEAAGIADESTIVEYGIQKISEKEQACALAGEINELSRRAANLARWGSQAAITVA